MLPNVTRFLAMFLAAGSFLLLPRTSAAQSIALGASPVNSVQIRALKPDGTILEIQLGGGSDEPPRDTKIVGPATVVIGAKKYAGYYRLSTNPAAQLRMKVTAAGKKQGVDKDEYGFLAGHDTLNFEFAGSTSFDSPWLTGQIKLVAATQLLPGDKGDDHPPIAFSGKISAPTGGSLAKSFAEDYCRLIVNVGGNQRLAGLRLGDTLSGMSLDKGSRYGLLE